jgi:hypothetical protein
VTTESVAETRDIDSERDDAAGIRDEDRVALIDPESVFQSIVLSIG